jgi:hypothetical protein
VRILKGLGIVLLVFLALIYQGGSAEATVWMRPYWWGILGLIGWAYFLNALVYLLSGNNLLVLGGLILVLSFLNVQEFDFFAALPTFKLVVSASNHVLVAAGVFCTALFLRVGKDFRENQFLGLVLLLAAVFTIYGFAVRPHFIISKNLATPSWTSICIGLGFASYAFFYTLADKWGISKWAAPFKPAGTSTLTCYLIPYLAYPLATILGISLAASLPGNLLGLGKSLLFSFAIILLVGQMERWRVRLKI